MKIYFDWGLGGYDSIQSGVPEAASIFHEIKVRP